MTMNKTGQVNVIDYAFLMAIGGIGIMVSIACLIFAAAAGFVTVGYYLAALSLVISALAIGKMLHSGLQASQNSSESLAGSHIEKPYVMTSLKGEMVHCNLPYRVFLKENLGRENLGPLELMDAEQQKIIKTTLAALVKGREELRIVPLISEKGEKKICRGEINPA